MKKVLHILYSGLGGHGSDFFSLVTGDAGNEYVHEAAFCGIETMRQGYAEQCGVLGIRFTYTAKKQGADPGFYRRLAGVIKKSGPDVILVYGLSFLPSAVWYKKTRRNIPVIVRDTQAHHLKSRSDWYWLKMAIYFADTIVVLSGESKEYLIKKYKRSSVSRRIIVIPNGIDTQKYHPVKKVTDQVTEIGMQSRLQAIKDHPTLLRAFATVQATHPQLRLQIAGDGATMDSLRQLTATLSLEDAVTFHGMLPEDQLIGFMHSLDIYIHATFGEMMSTSIMQAMACGLPVIASDVWGVSNMVTDQQDGLLYRSEDETDLRSKIELLLSDGALRDRLSSGARHTAVSRFSQEILFRHYKELFS